MNKRFKLTYPWEFTCVEVEDADLDIEYKNIYWDDWEIVGKDKLTRYWWTLYRIDNWEIKPYSRLPNNTPEYNAMYFQWIAIGNNSSWELTVWDYNITYSNTYWKTIYIQFWYIMYQNEWVSYWEIHAEYESQTIRKGKNVLITIVSNND